MSVLALFIEDESGDERNEEVLITIRKRKRVRDASNPLEMDETCFIANYRLTKHAFLDLLEQLSEKLRPSLRASSIPNVIKLACLLRFCAQGSYQLSVGNDFELGLAQPTVSLILNETLLAFEDNICPQWIKFDYTAEEKNRAKLFFYEKSNIPGILGCVDGTHIRIVAPKDSSKHLYYNRKGFYSLNAMIVCDDKTRIRYINAKFPGGTHDSMVWSSSALKVKMEEDYQNGGTNTWLLGDAGYPLLPYLITPFRSAQENSNEARFNERHTKARIIVERTIGILKNRFRCLLGHRALHYEPLHATRIANVCAALHNICLHYDINFEDTAGDEPLPLEVQHPEVLQPESNNVAVNIRNAILNTMFSR